jgi:hypothetical protein
MRHLDKVTILNISQTGMGLSAESALPTGTTIQVDFKLPKSEMHVQITGSVVWSHTSGRAGINIQHIAPEERQRLQHWLDSMPLPSSDFLPGTYRQPAPEMTEKQRFDSTQ